MGVKNNNLFSKKERIDQIRLIRSQHVGPVTYHRLMHRFGNAGDALRALPDISRQAGGKAPRLCTEDAAIREFENHEKAGADLVFHGENGYPPMLAAIEDAPAFISVRGNSALLGKKTIAVVGARNASANAQQLAQSLATDLGHAGLSVVSGLALGIDAAAHRGALASGTVAVLGGGVDVIYPRQNRKLHDAIAEAGALISEVRPGEAPTARHFPRRNRIISGMARGVVVVEASLRSGSLITARLAGEQGRDVFAVPGAAHDPRGRGTNQLLRDGAILTETAEDVFNAWSGNWQQASYRPPSVPKSTPPVPAIITDPAPSLVPCAPTTPSASALADGARRDIVAALGTTPSSIDDIVRHTGVPSDTAQMVFTELELGGRLQRHPGGRISLRAAV
ncbi:MAG: DNA-protecting protein DprA [Rhodospirillaceae bacterium]|jgi:DNA processing protein|nr:DNA-protecting protein DprA [Rhodospirillaceae bacterium]